MIRMPFHRPQLATFLKRPGFWLLLSVGAAAASALVVLWPRNSDPVVADAFYLAMAVLLGAGVVAIAYAGLVWPPDGDGAVATAPGAEKPSPGSPSADAGHRASGAVAATGDAFEQMPAGYFSADIQGRLRHVNARLSDWLGVSPNDLSGCFFADFVSASDIVSETEQMSIGHVRVTPRGPHLPFDALLIQNGHVVDGDFCHTRSLLLRDLAPAFESRLPAATSVQKTESRDPDAFARPDVDWLYEHAPIAIAVLDATGTIQRGNRAFESLVSARQASLPGRMLVDFLMRENREAVTAAFSKTIQATTKIEHLDARLVAGGDQGLTLSLIISPRLDKTGAPVGIVVHALDTTEHRNLQIQFAQAQKMQAIGQLAGGVAHDFNNLLTAMIGFSDLLLIRHGPEDPDFADIMQIRQNANRAAGLVRQLLAFSRKQRLEPQLMSVTDTLSDLSHLLKRLIGEQVTLDMGHANDIGSILFEKGQFEQIILNLCVNARDAMPGGGVISIRTERKVFITPMRRGQELMPASTYAMIEIADTGVGIDVENLNRVFEPFFSTKEAGVGTGLGLSTVHGIVHQGCGFIFVDSEIGVGTIFTLYLPEHTGEGAFPVVARSGRRAPARPRDLTGSATVLLVEDEAAVRMFGATAPAWQGLSGDRCRRRRGGAGDHRCW